MRGRVAWFDDKKGYGFITPPAGADVFVHRRVLQGYDELQTGARVEFDVVMTAKGLEARNVRVVGLVQHSQ